MAKVKNNAITSGLSGKYADQMVFRQVGDKTFVVKKPGPRTKPASKAQQANERRFSQAIAYAKAAMADVSLRAVYDAGRGKRAAFRVALSDFCNVPVIRGIEAGGYAGAAGQHILVMVMDDFKVMAVNVAICDAKGMLIEEGAAVAAGDGLRWVYTTVVGNVAVAGGRVTVTARDYPGNSVMEELVLT